MSKICEVCGHNLNGPIVNFGAHPLCDDLLKIGTKETVPEFIQEVQLCSMCLTAHQLHQVEKNYLFKDSYHYRSALTKDVLSGMEDLVNSVSTKISLDDDSVILDVGCNDGSLLSIFKTKFGCMTIGVDPTDAIKDNAGGIDFPFQEFFDTSTAEAIISKYGSPDVITFTNVFAHIEDLPSLLRALGILCKPSTLLVIENHYLGSILSRNQFDTFYHEHPRTYSAKSFEYIAKDLNMQINAIDFPKRYGGNVRVMMSQRNTSESRLIELPSEEDFLERFENLGNYYATWKFESLKVIEALSLEGPIYGKSLPGRAVMLISSLGINAKLMPSIFEQNSSPKVGYYVPGSNIEIHSDSEIMSLKPKRLVVWSWHIIDEICVYLSDIGFRGEVWVPLPKFEVYKVL